MEGAWLRQMDGASRRLPVPSARPLSVTSEVMSQAEGCAPLPTPAGDAPQVPSFPHHPLRSRFLVPGSQPSLALFFFSCNISSISSLLFQSTVQQSSDWHPSSSHQPPELLHRPSRNHGTSTLYTQPPHQRSPYLPLVFSLKEVSKNPHLQTAPLFAIISRLYFQPLSL